MSISDKSPLYVQDREVPITRLFKQVLEELKILLDVIRQKREHSARYIIEENKM